MTDPSLPDGWAFFDQAPGALALADDKMVIVRTNAAFCALTGRSGDELVGRDGYELMREEDRDGARERVAAMTAEGKPYAVDQCFEHADGHPLWLRVHVAVVTDASGTRFFMGQIEDTSDHRRTTARLKRLAERDHLTGLLNRRRVEEELEAVLAGIRRHGRLAALILVDLDNFKDVNDREGHEAGDQVLSFVAATLATRVREEDAVGRLGGDEFAVILRDATLEAAEAVADALVKQIADAGYTRERGVTMSAGVAALTADIRNAQDALHAADLAMYAAKAAGRDRVEVHVPGAAVAVAPRPAPVPVAPREGTGLLDGLKAVAEAPTVDHALEAVRELLGMDVAYITRHEPDEQRLVAARGDLDAFGGSISDHLAHDGTYCAAVLRGELPAVLPDTRAHPVAAAMPVTEEAGIGAYAAVPIRLSDGSLYGMLCAVSREKRERLGDRDLQFLSVLSRLLAGELERDAALRAQLDLRVQAAGAEALLSAIEARDRYTGAHSRDVVDLAAKVAAELALDERVQREVAQVALLHDIGKLALPDAILSKPGPLSYDEIVQLRQHPEDGERIIAAIPELKHLAPAIRAEHERWDGTGYPDGLAGEEIPISSRIVFVCDAWDAMTSDRPYRSRLPRDEALAELAANASSQFCILSVQALFNVLSRG